LRVVVGLGANLGDRIATLRAAVAKLSSVAGVRVLARSHVYETAAVGPPQPDYLNAAILAECTIPLDDLMTELLAIEKSLGRERLEKWGPRTLDLDILWAEGVTQSTVHVTVPHPHLHERSFAIKPLLDVAPEATDPKTNTRYADLRLPDASDVRLATATL